MATEAPARIKAAIEAFQDQMRARRYDGFPDEKALTGGIRDSVSSMKGLVLMEGPSVVLSPDAHKSYELHFLEYLAEFERAHGKRYSHDREGITDVRKPDLVLFDVSGADSVLVVCEIKRPHQDPARYAHDLAKLRVISELAGGANTVVGALVFFSGCASKCAKNQKLVRHICGRDGLAFIGKDATEFGDCGW